MLREGEMELLAPDRARALLAALKERSGEDPCFDAEDRDVHRASGLMRPELKDDIVRVLAEPGPHAQLSAFLIQAMGATDLTAEDARMLESILFDRDRDNRERARAFWTLDARIPVDDEAVILRLLDLGDAGSARFACEILASMELDDATARRSPAAERSGPEPAGGDDTAPQGAASPSHEPFGSLDTARLAGLLDIVAKAAPAVIAEAEDWQRVQLTDTGRRLAARVLEADPAVAPERVWAWIRWTDKAEGASSRERLAGVFGRDRALRAAVLEHALTTSHPGGVSAACRELGKTGLGIGAVAEDHDGLAEALRIRSENRSIDPRTWWDIIELARPMLLHAGQEGAAAGGEGETPVERGKVFASLPAVLGALGWEVGSGASSELKADGESTRDALAGQPDKVAAGDYRVLAVAAEVYLGRIEGNGENANRDPSLGPAERLRDFLGEDLCGRVLEGFVAVLGRDDLPPASAIAQIHCAEGEHEAEAPLICAVDVALRRSLPLDRFERASLEAALMAWQCAPSGELRGLTDIGPDLEAAVFRGAEDMERHYRTCIEPRLACNAEFVNELDGPGGEHGGDFRRLIGRLSLEWLRIFPRLNGQMQTELMICALENSPRKAVRELIVGCRGRVHPDERAKLTWLSVACVVDLEGYRDAVLDAVENHPDFLGFVREQVGSVFFYEEVSLDTLRLLVRVFGKRWPRTLERPGRDRTDRGWNDPGDASAFIERTIHAIAGRREPEAEDALVDLIENHAPSYAETAREALAFQRMARRDHEHRIPTVAELRAAIEGDAE